MQIALLKFDDDTLNFIGDCAGICYNAPRNKAANERRAIQCAKKGHLATLRFATATFHVSGISRSCSHQFVRSKHLDFLQQSQRYVNQYEQAYVDPFKYGSEVEILYDRAIAYSKTIYKELLNLGVKKENARFVLPEAIHTELVVTGNLQAWLDFIKLRSGPDAQWEIRSVAKTINSILHQKLPDIFEESQ